MSNETVLIYKRSRERAREVLAAARAVGLPTSVVRTTEDGYLVPEAVAQYIEGTWKSEPEPAPEAEEPPAPKRRRRTKKSEDEGSTDVTEDKKE